MTRSASSIVSAGSSSAATASSPLDSSDSPSTTSPSTDATAASRWLFPGGFAGCHLDPETLANRLRQLGISSAKLRTDVLLDLAADIPPAIVADLIGLYPTTAARWTHAAGGDWAGYVAQRSDEDRRRGSTG